MKEMTYFTQFLGSDEFHKRTQEVMEFIFLTLFSNGYTTVYDIGNELNQLTFWLPKFNFTFPVNLDVKDEEVIEGTKDNFNEFLEELIPVSYSQSAFLAWENYTGITYPKGIEDPEFLKNLEIFKEIRFKMQVNLFKFLDFLEKNCPEFMMKTGKSLLTGIRQQVFKDNAEFEFLLYGLELLRNKDLASSDNLHLLLFFKQFSSIDLTAALLGGKRINLLNL